MPVNFDEVAKELEKQKDTGPFAQAGIAPDVERNPVEKWFNQAAQDVRYGSKMTALGRALAALGATGTQSGQPEAVGEFMGSPVTGTLRALEGASQIPQKPIEGAQNVLGGVMEAATIPSMLMPMSSAPRTAYTAAARAIEDVPIPFKPRAAKRFAEVMAKAKDVPIDVTKMEPAIKQAQLLSETGSHLPKVLSDFIKAKNAPIPYRAGREFASSAGQLSTAEKMATDPRMQAQVSKFAEAIASANREAAASMGMEKQYDLAMKEYRMASQLARGAKTAGKLGAAAVGAKTLYDIASKYF